MKLNFLGGQRMLITLLTLILTVCGFILGSVDFPNIEIGDGVVAPVEGQVIDVEAQTVISPDFLIDTLGKALAPLALIAASLVALFRALSARVNNPNDPFQASDFLSLLKSKEFWTHIVALLVGAGQMAGFRLIDEGQQAELVAGIMSITTVLLYSYGNRPSGVTQEVAKLEVSVTNPTSS